MARAGNHLVYFESRQLAAFTRLGALCHFYLYFVGIHQIFRSNAEASGCHLFDGAAHFRSEACGIFTAFTRIASPVQLVHGNRHCLMRFLTDGAERHGPRNETSQNAFHRLHLVYGNGAVTEVEEVSQEDRPFFLVDQAGKLFELLVAAQTGGYLQGTDSFRIPSVLFAVLAVCVQSFVWQ